MKPIRILLAVLFSTIFLFSCNNMRTITEVPVKTETVIKERVVPVVVSNDSVFMQALFRCDSSNKVIMTQFDEYKTQHAVTSQSFKNGVLSYRTIIKHDTVFVKVTDTLIVKDVPIVVTKEVAKKPPNWQIVLMCLGVGFIILAIVAVYRKIKNLI